MEQRLQNAEISTTVYKVNSSNYDMILRKSDYMLDDREYTAYELKTNQKLSKDKIYHPFHLIESENIDIFSDGGTSIGEIVAKNIVTDSMFQLIMSNDEVLKKKSGIQDHLEYRSILIKMVYDLWD